MTKKNQKSLPISCLAKQLRCPKGIIGEDIGHIMFESNKGMITESIAALKLKPRKRVLEIGPGNGKHLELILQQAKELRYFGLEISDTMINEADVINYRYVNNRRALFQKYDGQTMPYVHDFFDQILTVNTIYFWENHKDFLTELYRVLKPGGTCVVTFVSAEFMQNLPFVNESFQLFNINKMKSLVLETPFELAFFRQKSEEAKSKSGEVVTRDYIISILKKEPKIMALPF